MTIKDIDGIEIFFNIKKETGEIFGHRVRLTDEVKDNIVSLINNSSQLKGSVLVEDTPTYKKGVDNNETCI